MKRAAGRPLWMHRCRSTELKQIEFHHLAVTNLPFRNRCVHKLFMNGCKRNEEAVSLNTKELPVDNVPDNLARPTALLLCRHTIITGLSISRFGYSFHSRVVSRVILVSRFGLDYRTCSPIIPVCC